MGQPRVGTSKFSVYAQSQLPNHYRVINYADTVVHAPPKAFGFIHSGHEIWYNPRGMQTYANCVSEDPNCANSVSTLNFSTDDHSLDNYKRMKTSYSWLDRILAIGKQHLKK